MKFGIDPDDIIAALAQAAGTTLNRAQNRFRQSMKSLANATAGHARDLADLRLNSTAAQYKDAIIVEQVDPETYRVTLDPSVVHLEEGYDSFDMKPGLLKNAKKRSKEGYRYRVIPLGTPPEAAGSKKDPRHNIQRQISTKAEDRAPNELPVGQTTEGLIATSLIAAKNALFNKRGRPEQDGPVGRFDPDPMNDQAALFTPHGSKEKVRLDLGSKFNELLHGMQMSRHTSKGGKTSFSYQTFRVVSENPKYAQKWMHPGFQGARIFPDLEPFVDDKIKKIMDRLVDGI